MSRRRRGPGVLAIDGHLFVERCSSERCDGAHVTIKIGEAGKDALARHVTDAAGARSLAALLCAKAAEIEAAGLATKPS